VDTIASQAVVQLLVGLEQSGVDVHGLPTSRAILAASKDPGVRVPAKRSSR
jgi:hypothetical protein